METDGVVTPDVPISDPVEGRALGASLQPSDSGALVPDSRAGEWPARLVEGLRAGRRWAGTEVDARSVQAFRVVFGVLLAVMPVRFAAYGWIESLYVVPEHHFPWVEWAVVPSATALYAMHVVLALAGLSIALGRFYRPALAVYLAVFGYIELLDKTLYLNHYVLVTLLVGTLLVGPGRPGVFHIPRWASWLLRLEFGLVWFWAGVCKLNADWLFRAEPLHTWLRARIETPIVGPLLGRWEVALAMSWGGMLFDLSIFFLLCGRRTRRVGLALLLGFHFATGVLFPIGVFPWVMLAGALLFVPPFWGVPVNERSQTMALRTAVPVGLFVVFLVLFPARHLLEPGWVNWNERGFRFAWRVLLVEKTAQLDYRVHEPATGRSWTVYPARELTELQFAQMRSQPDMILDYAHHVFERNGAAGRAVEVFARSRVSLNGRRSQVLIDPEVDLARVEYRDAGWIVPFEPDPSID